jgi:hypothetical protein
MSRPAAHAFLAMRPPLQLRPAWDPTFVGMSGFGGCVKALLLTVMLALAGPARAASPIAALAADLAAHPSATEVLQRWCADRHIADPAVIVAERQRGRDKPATAEVRALLHAAPGETIRYRRVALACGGHVLSNADNWYRPAQLTAAMNAELDGTDHPFGAVVRPLQFHRESLEARVLAGPGDILRNKALLETPDGTPFSLVVETYAREAVAGR